ncbi:MAG: CHAD domain-containing protein [Phenylobacterium sp.]
MTDIDREIELKFLCAPRDLAAVLAAAPAGDDQSHELISVYFDTPDLDLQKAGASLRVRESGGKRVQTLKRGEGLCREEYEQPISGDVPDPELGPLKALLPRDGAGVLKPSFNVRVSRRQRLVGYGGAQIELALDVGEVRGGRRASPISEVELELKRGPPKALFELARELARAAPLYLSFEGKAARGQALVAGAPVLALRKARVELARDATAAEAFQAIARNALAQIAGNAALLREAPDAEAVHQLRVAARRLRSAISTFAPVLGDGGAVKAELRWLAKACDNARNLHVFAAETLEPAQGLADAPAGLAALAAAVEAARAPAEGLAYETVGSARFRNLLIEATAWVETGDWLSAADGGGSARAFAADSLERRRRKLLKRGRSLKRADDAGRHAARIEAKKLRYAVEAFESLFRAKAAQRFIERLKALQDELGALNDLATAETLIEGLALEPAAAFAAGELVGLKAAGKSRRVGRAARAFDRLADTDRFWR